MIQSVYRLTILAFIVNIMLPFFALYQVPRASAADTSRSAFEVKAQQSNHKILICTSEGFKWVAWNDIQKNENTPTPSTPYKCALCYISAFGGAHIIPVTPTIFVTVIQKPSLRYDFDQEVQLLVSWFTSLQSRAPPYLS